MEILDRTYTLEEFADAERDVSESLEHVVEAIDPEGSVRVTVEYIEEGNE